MMADATALDVASMGLDDFVSSECSEMEHECGSDDTLLDISHVFFDERLLIEDVNVRLDTKRKCLTITGGAVTEICPVGNIESLEFFVRQCGPMIYDYFDSDRFETIVVLRLAASQTFFDAQVPAGEPIVLAFKQSFGSLYPIEVLVYILEPYLSSGAARLSSSRRYPHFVKAILPQVTHFTKDEAHDSPSIESARPDAGKKTHQLSEAGLASLASQAVLNDEVIDSAFGGLQKQFPHVHVFDSCSWPKINSALEKFGLDDGKMNKSQFDDLFGSFFAKMGGASRQVEETFFDKKMLIFPVCFDNHWFLIVVVNPLLADGITRAGSRNDPSMTCHKQTAYWIDSRQGSPVCKDDVLQSRLDQTWFYIYRFLRLAAYHTLGCYLGGITCSYDSIIPSQTNAFDSGVHAIINAHLMAEMYDDLLNGPDRVEITGEKATEVKEKVDKFRVSYKKQLEM